MYTTREAIHVYILYFLFTKKIKKKQKILRKLTRLYGFTHPLVVAYSQELDQLVVLVMRSLSS
ncbi:Spo0E family sporulation regulatory protein-aspartic acid phosphatase [Bacillus cereus]